MENSSEIASDSAMIFQWRFMLLGALLLAMTASGQTIYRCQTNGRTTFSDKPCDDTREGKSSAAGKTRVSPETPDSVDAISGYTAPHGSWRGQAQYQAKIGTQLVEEAHAVVPIVVSIEFDGKVAGGSADNGCRLLGIASPGVIKTMLNLDVTLSACKHSLFNRRYSGLISINAKDKTAQLYLNAHIIRSGYAPEFFDLKGTLRR